MDLAATSDKAAGQKDLSPCVKGRMVLSRRRRIRRRLVGSELDEVAGNKPRSDAEMQIVETGKRVLPSAGAASDMTIRTIRAIRFSSSRSEAKAAISAARCTDSRVRLSAVAPSSISAAGGRCWSDSREIYPVAQPRRRVLDRDEVGMLEDNQVGRDGRGHSCDLGFGQRAQEPPAGAIASWPG